MRTIIDDDEPYPIQELGKREREQIASSSARYALSMGLKVGTAMAAFVLISSIFTKSEPDRWPIWLTILGWYVICFIGFFCWQRHSMLKNAQAMIDATNARSKEQYFRDKNAETRSTGMAPERGDD